jgi:hypothetical protein
MRRQDKRWILYEKVIEDLEGQDQNCEIIRDYHVKGRESGILRQVDVWIRASVGGMEHPTTVAVECRAYGSKNKIGIRDVDAFYGFLQDVGADKGALVTTSSFTKGAKARAEGGKIETQVLTFEEALAFKWREYVLEDRCATYSGCWGTVGWSYHEKPSESVYGYCGECGTFHIRCGLCGEYDYYSEREGSIRCSNEDCRGVFAVRFGKDGIASFTAELWEEEEYEEEDEERD